MGASFHNLLGQAKQRMGGVGEGVGSGPVGVGEGWMSSAAEKLKSDNKTAEYFFGTSHYLQVL